MAENLSSMKSWSIHQASTYVFLTFDHRVFDGLEVGRILADMQKLLENPELITV